MSKVHSIDFEYDHDYALIAIHSILEDYRLAFHLNDALGLRLKRFKEDLDFERAQCSFPLFVFEDEKRFAHWSVISNKDVVEREVTSSVTNLFQQESKTSYLIPEKKQVDYFIKIDGVSNGDALNEIMKSINQIHKVITSYPVDPFELKSRDNLIF